MKSQVKMAETIAILVIFFFLLVFGYSFYAGVQQFSFKRQIERNLDLRAVQVALKASFLPEVQCSVKNNPTDNCLDSMKVELLSNMIGNDPAVKSHYLGIFGSSELRIEELYPAPSVPAELLLYDSHIANASMNLSTKVPISLYNPKDGKYSFAVLKVFVYEK